MNLAEQFNPAPKQQHKRRTPKKVNRGRFSPLTTQRIFEYDEHRCAYCRSYRIESVPHHILYKSQGGLGTFDNGATVCPDCHKWAHGLRKGVNGEATTEGRKWFEQYRQRKLEEAK